MSDLVERKQGPNAWRKRPVVVEALQYTDPASVLRIMDAFGSKGVCNGPDGLSIYTLEGEMRANKGDWIIRGIHGELYPCKPDIFEATYEPAEALTAQDARIVELKAERDEACELWKEACSLAADDVRDMNKTLRAAEARALAAEAEAASWKADAGETHLRLVGVEARVGQPISFEDVRLVAGEGSLSGPAVIHAVNIILARRAEALSGVKEGASQSQPCGDGGRPTPTEAEPSADRANTLARMRASKDYRVGYVQSWIAGVVPNQIRYLREARGLTQAAMAALMEKPQSVLSRLENNHADSVTLRSLWAVADALDVALIVEFVDFPEFVERTSDCSPAALARAVLGAATASPAEQSARPRGTQDHLAAPPTTPAKPEGEG